MLLLAIAAAQAQDKFPDKAVRILVGFTGGSATDVLARTIAQKMSEKWEQPVIVENRPGAGGVLASDLVNRSAPDGHTIMIVGNSHTANPSRFAKLPYDTLKDFAGVTFLANIPDVLCVSPSMGAKSVRELIAQAKANPGKINYGSSGVGTGTHMLLRYLILPRALTWFTCPSKARPTR